MSDAISYVNKFNEIIKNIEHLLFITRDSNLQKEGIDTLSAMRNECGLVKQACVSEGNENFANLFLGLECVAQSLSSELEMWLLLKEEKPDDAWNKLIDAQTAAADSIRAHDGFSHNISHVERLEEIERVVFPLQVFLSSGLIVRHQECSVCGEEYGECEHLAGKPYWGEFCFIIAKDFEADHVALVKDPADKRCRIMNFSVDGGWRNRMTWKINLKSLESESIPHEEKNDSGLRTNAVLLHQDTIYGRRK